jgi:hypothetical protein
MIRPAVEHVSAAGGFKDDGNSHSSLDKEFSGYGVSKRVIGARNRTGA